MKTTHSIVRAFAVGWLSVYAQVTFATTTNDLAITAVTTPPQPALQPAAILEDVQYVIMNNGPQAVGSLATDGSTNAQVVRVLAYLARDPMDTNALYVGDRTVNLFLQAGETCTNRFTGLSVPSPAFDKYFVRLSLDLNMYGGVVDLQAQNNSLTGRDELVVQAPPVIAADPSSITLLNASAVTFQAAATGSLPLRYQWRFQGIPLVNQTNSTLTILPLFQEQEGAYDLVVSNDFGLAVSRVAWLFLPTLTAPSPRLGGWIHGDLPAGNYLVAETLNVSNSLTLRIAAGARLRFSTNSGLTVSGTLRAMGTAASPVRFFGADESLAPGWGGVVLQSAALVTNVLTYTEILGASTGVSVTTAKARALLGQCRVSSCSVAGLMVSPSGYLNQDYLVVEDSVITTNLTGVRVSGHASGCSGSQGGVTLRRCEISYNQGSGVECSGSGSSRYGCLFAKTGSAVAVMDACTIHHNGTAVSVAAWDGYYADGFARADLTNSVLVSNAQGVVVRGDDPSEVSMMNNTVAHNLGAALRYEAVQLHKLDVINNLFFNNSTGLAAHKPYTNAVPIIINNDVFGNGANWINWPEEFGRLTTVNRLGHPSDPYGNISLDPMVHPDASLRLTINSPLIDAGSTNQAPRFDFDGEPRDSIPDIGFDEVVLRPRILVADGSLGFRTNRFGFSLTDSSGRVVVVEATTNLLDWLPLQTNVVGTSPVYFSDPSAGSYRGRFYRIRR